MSDEHDTNGPSDIDNPTENLRRELQTKPGIWAIVGAMAAITAIPIAILAVWFPREIDGLRRDVTLASENAAAAAMEAEAARQASQQVLDRLDGLVVAIARNDATQPFNSGFVALQKLLPRDLVAAIEAAQVQKAFRYSNFGGEQWIFVNSKAFNCLSSDNQNSILQAFQRVDARFTSDEFVPIFDGDITGTGANYGQWPSVCPPEQQ